MLITTTLRDSLVPKSHHEHAPSLNTDLVPKAQRMAGTNARRLTLVPENFYSMDNGTAYYIYKGVFDRIEDVPKYRCLYVIGSKLYRRQVHENPNVQKGRKKRVADNSRLLDVTIRDEDNDLMVITKRLLAENGVTVDQFKKLFDNVSDMNNMRRAIECGGQGNFSWNRFKQMVDKMGYRHHLSVVRAEDALEGRDWE